MPNPPVPPNNSRLGFHYFPDTQHYRECDLNAWLPELHGMGTTWLTLVAPYDRAIPEVFVRGLVTGGIEPILHVHLPLDLNPQEQNFRILWETYARWGIHYVALFDRPNWRASWPATAWAQTHLVERFLDIYLPLAESLLQAGLIPVFPPLEPGGDYWDTAFLRAALQGIQRRGHTNLLKTLVLGAYAWPGSRPLNWGAGGPERWPGARPYITPADMQDQIGFYIFDWYLAISQAVLGEPRPIMLLGAGSRPADCTDSNFPPIDRTSHAHRNLMLAQKMLGQSMDELSAPISPEVLACNFWLLAASPNSSHAPQAWFQPDGQTLPVVGAFRQWIASHPKSWQPTPSLDSLISTQPIAHSIPPISHDLFHLSPDHPIPHYLLLPTYEWGIADWHLDVIRPFIKKYRPTIGFSPEEAALAARVTVIGGAQSFSEAILEHLRASGCTVERISGDGMKIATVLSER